MILHDENGDLSANSTDECMTLCFVRCVVDEVGEKVDTSPRVRVFYEISSSLAASAYARHNEPRQERGGPYNINFRMPPTLSTPSSYPLFALQLHTSLLATSPVLEIGYAACML
jgi:hypothetical protein